MYSILRFKPGGGLLCRILGRGLGCALIRSTLDSGNPGRVGNLGGEGTREQWGTKGDQFTSNLGLRWTIPVTTGGCQVSRSGNSKGKCMYRMYRNLCPYTYMLNDCSDKKIPVVHI
jgi:hypothetical protein